MYCLKLYHIRFIYTYPLFSQNIPNILYISYLDVITCCIFANSNESSELKITCDFVL